MTTSPYVTAMRALADLQLHLSGLGRVLLGYSGGVDSSLVAVVARGALPRADLLAVIGRSASYPDVQYRAAVDLARQFDVPLHELDTHELADPRYQANSPGRCFFCKQELWGRLRPLADTLGYPVIIDGTHAEDLHEHRPGQAAASASAVQSPLATLGWSKAMVRAAARSLGIPNWDAPASPCLASRIQYGLPVTSARLSQVEQGESLLRAEGITGDVRLRHRGDHATVEVPPGALDELRLRWPAILPRLLTLGFMRVELDPVGYRRGSLLVPLSRSPLPVGDASP